MIYPYEPDYHNHLRWRLYRLFIPVRKWWGRRRYERRPTLTIELPEGVEVRVDREWVEKGVWELRFIGKWMDTNPEAKAAYGKFIDANPDLGFKVTT